MKKRTKIQPSIRAQETLVKASITFELMTKPSIFLSEEVIQSELDRRARLNPKFYFVNSL